MSKTMIRVEKDKNNPYVMLNKGFLNNSELSWQAKGLLSYLLSLPDDWKIYESELSSHAKGGVKYVSSIMKELINNDYINRRKLKGSNGRFMGYEYCVHEVSTVMPQTENGEAENRERQTTNNNLTKNNSTNNDKNKNGAKPDGICPTPVMDVEVEQAIGRYFELYRKNRYGVEHPSLKTEQFNTVYTRIHGFMDEHGLDGAVMEDIMSTFFGGRDMQTDFNINHFATNGIMLNCMYETIGNS